MKGHIKQKYLKSNIINPMQSYLYVVIEQEKNDWCYQSKYKLKLGKIIQSLHAADDKAAIVKYAEYAVKNKEDFASLLEDSLTHITQLPTSLTKTQIFFIATGLNPLENQFILIFACCAPQIFRTSLVTSNIT